MVKNLSAEVKALIVRKVLVVADKGIIKAGLLERIEQFQQTAELEFAVFDGVEPCQL